MKRNPTEQRLSFLIDYASGQWSMSELCERYRVSRPTGYKWLKRVEEEGEHGLAERSRVRKSSPHQAPTWMEQRILEIRAKYGWGAKKLRQILCGRYPMECWPARSTINAILDRHGKLRKQRRRRKWSHPGAAALVTERPNQVWLVDFKGQFKTRDGIYCYPLTVTDHFSRSVLLCKALPSVKTKGTFRLKAAQPFLSQALAEQYVGLEEIGDGLWNIVYYRTLLGRIDERTTTITGV